MVTNMESSHSLYCFGTAEEVLSYHACKLWKTSTGDRYSYICGRIWLISDTITRKFQSTTIADILASIPIKASTLANASSILIDDNMEDTCRTVLKLNLFDFVRTVKALNGGDQVIIVLIHPGNYLCFLNSLDVEGEYYLTNSRPNCFLDEVRTVGHRPDSNASREEFLFNPYVTVYYNNSFDPRLLFDGLYYLFEKTLVDSATNHLAVSVNTLLTAQNASTLLEQSLLVYRLLLIAMVSHSVPCIRDTDEADGDWSLTSLHDPWAGCSILGSASPLINREDPDTAQLLNRLSDYHIQILWIPDEIVFSMAKEAQRTKLPSYVGSEKSSKVWKRDGESETGFPEMMFNFNDAVCYDMSAPLGLSPCGSPITTRASGVFTTQDDGWLQSEKEKPRKPSSPPSKRTVSSSLSELCGSKMNPDAKPFSFLSPLRPRITHSESVPEMPLVDELMSQKPLQRVVPSRPTSGAGTSTAPSTCLSSAQVEQRPSELERIYEQLRLQQQRAQLQQAQFMAHQQMQQVHQQPVAHQQPAAHPQPIAHQQAASHQQPLMHQQGVTHQSSLFGGPSAFGTPAANQWHPQQSNITFLMPQQHPGPTRMLMPQPHLLPAQMPYIMQNTHPFSFNEQQMPYHGINFLPSHSSSPQLNFMGLPNNL